MFAGKMTQAPMSVSAIVSGGHGSLALVPLLLC